MKPLNKFPPEYFVKYREKPVKIKPYNQKQGEIGKLYVNKIREKLKNYEVKVQLKGSSLYKIAGKGEVEVGIYPNEYDWNIVLKLLEESFGKPDNIEDDYARFNQIYEDTEIEIIVLKGYEAIVDQKLTDYLMSHTNLLKDYEKVKINSAHSKREYQIQKNKFLSGVIEKIPD